MLKNLPNMLSEIFAYYALHFPHYACVMLNILHYAGITCQPIMLFIMLTYLTEAYLISCSLDSNSNCCNCKCTSYTQLHTYTSQLAS